MNSLDSFSMIAPLHVVRRYNEAAMWDNCSQKRGTNQLIADAITPGLNKVVLDFSREQVVINGSAKILADDYFKGININTIEQAIAAMNRSGVLELDSESLIHEGQFKNIDITNNIDIRSGGYTMNEALDALQFSFSNTAFHAKRYDRQKGGQWVNRGIVFTGTQKTEKNRQIFYDKLADLMKAPNRGFLASLRDPAKMISEAGHVLRCEVNNTALESIRKRLQTTGTGILHVLNSTAPANLNFLNKVLQQPNPEQIRLFSQYQGQDLDDIVRMEGYRHIIRELNYNPDLLKAFVKQHTSEENFRWWWYGRGASKPGFKQVLQAMNLEEQQGTINPIIEHIKQQLSA